MKENLGGGGGGGRFDKMMHRSLWTYSISNEH